MCGAYEISEKYRNDLASRGFLFDDTGDNVSHLNHWLGDLTGLYWVWKNTSDEFVGTNHYRRFWDESFISTLSYQPNTLYVNKPGYFTCDTYHQYVEAHTEIGLIVLREAASQGKLNITTEMVDQLKQVNFLFTCGMFFGERKIFDKVCEVLFENIFELYHGSKYVLPYIQPQDQKRMIAFVGERILTLIYMNKERYLGNVDLQPVPYNYNFG